MLDRTKNLSEHFSLGELTKTSFKTDDNNEPPLEVVENLIDLCENWLEELRFNYNTIYVLNSIEDYYTSKEVEPLVINQGYRSYQVMLAMKKAGLNPSPTSNHMKGCAVDIRCAGVEQALRYMTILIDIADQKRQDFDELFLERRAYKATYRQGAEQQANRQQATINRQPPIANGQQLMANGYIYWLHFAARPKDNRRKIGFILK